MRYAMWLLQVLVFLICSTYPAYAERRVALLVGVNEYENVPKLRKAVGDATALGERLRQMDFDVSVVFDPDRKTLIRALAELRNRARDADTVLVHFSGHGVVIGGENYILPKDISKPGTDADLIADEALSQTELLRKVVSSAEKKTIIVIIDACRDSPYAAPDRPLFGVKGLARVEPPEGVFIMYSAGFGQTALDSLGTSDAEMTSVYTRALINELGKPGRSLIDIANDLRSEVRRLASTVSHAQTPAFYDQVDGRKIVLLPDGAGQTESSPTQEEPKTDVAAKILEVSTQPVVLPRPLDSSLVEASQVWIAIQDSKRVADLEEFRAKYPTSFYAKLAEHRIAALTEAERLEAGAQASTPISPPLLELGPEPEAQRPIRPGFDCRRASSRSERFICSDADLADADRRLNLRYTSALASTAAPGRQRLKQEQRYWLAGREAACALPGKVAVGSSSFDRARSCLLQLIEGRISEIRE
jgi:uncharacterized protein YecT (DUF1311 family)